MDTISLSYFLELTKDLHFTNTAERLFISQQTLSNHIHRLEEELNTTLIERHPKRSLTTSGLLLQQFATEILKANDNLAVMIEDINDESRGIINFGAPNLRMNAFMPDVLTSFSKKYPNVQVNLHENISKQLIASLDSGSLDLALVVSGQDTSVSEEHVFHDQVYYCIRSSLLKNYFENDSDDIINQSLFGINLKLFEDIPVCALSNQIGAEINNIYCDLDISPTTYITSSSLQTCASIGLKGQAAFFTTKTSLSLQKDKDIDDDDPVYIFPIYYKNSPLSQAMSLVTPHGKYQPSYLLYFKDILKQHIQSLDYAPFIGQIKK